MNDGRVRDYLCVISEYAEYGMRASQDLGRLAKPKFSAGGVSYACVNPTRYSPHASLACFRTRPTRSSPELTPATRHRIYEPVRSRTLAPNRIFRAERNESSDPAICCKGVNHKFGARGRGTARKLGSLGCNWSSRTWLIAFMH